MPLGRFALSGKRRTFCKPCSVLQGADDLVDEEIEVVGELLGAPLGRFRFHPVNAHRENFAAMPPENFVERQLVQVGIEGVRGPFIRGRRSIAGERQPARAPVRAGQFESTGPHITMRTRRASALGYRGQRIASRYDLARE